MKKLLPVYQTTLTSTQLQQLTTITEERLDVLPANTTGNTFTAADLWNIQRNKRSFGQRRFIR